MARCGRILVVIMVPIRAVLALDGTFFRETAHVAADTWSLGGRFDLAGVVIVLTFRTRDTRGGVARRVVPRPAHDALRLSSGVIIVVSSCACDASDLAIARVRAWLGIAAFRAADALGVGLAVVVLTSGITYGAGLGTSGREGTKSTCLT